MFGKTIIFFVAIFILMSVAACSSMPDALQTKEVELPETSQYLVDTFLTSDKMRSKVSFVELLEIGNCVVVGTCVSVADVEDKEGYAQYEFKIEKVLRGDVPEETISFIEQEHHYGPGLRQYNPGEEYILVMEKRDSVFYETPQYSTFYFVYLPLVDLKKSTMDGELIPELSENATLEYVTKIVSEAKTLAKDSEGARYSTATDIPTLVEEADFILEIEITGENFTRSVDRTSYACKVRQVFKKRPFETEESVKSQVTTAILAKEAVKDGGVYIIMLNVLGEEETITILIQSSRNSIFVSTDEKAVKEIEEAVQKYQELNK